MRLRRHGETSAIRGAARSGEVSGIAAPTLATTGEPAPRPIHVVHVEGRGASAKVRGFLDFAAERRRGDALPA